MQRPIVLIGFMGTGKTTVGRLLAMRLGWPFVDLDARLSAEAGMTIPQIFQHRGEDEFRRLEGACLANALAEGQIVIATGGGAACRQDNLTLMLNRAFVVALTAPLDEIVRRTGRLSGRPLLDGASDPKQAAAALLATREPHYAQAHLRVETANRAPQAIADEILLAVNDKEPT